MENKRIYTIDLLKVISMSGIVLVHLLNHGGVIRTLEVNSLKYYIINILLTLSYLTVNIFAIITGYLYSTKKEIKISNILKLISEVLFYSFFITLIFYILNLYNIREQSKMNILYYIFPFLKGRYWYITCYCFLFFIIPFLNVFIKNISDKMLKKLLIIVFVLICVWGEFSALINFICNEKIISDMFHIDSGYSPFWLIYCYLVGAYLFKINNLNKKINNKKLIIKIIILLLITSSLSYISKLVAIKIFNDIKNYELFISYISPFNILLSSLIVILFVNHNSKQMNWISNLSKSSFAVYIIHSHILIYDNLIKDSMVNVCNRNILGMILYIMSVVFVVYILSYLIDIIREKAYEIFKINNFFIKIDNKK